MVTINSDSPHIKRAFENLIETLEEAGSGFHSQLCIDASAKGIRVYTKEPMAKGKEIIRIPRIALMPGDQYGVKLAGDNLVIDYFPGSTLKDRQKKVIDQMFEIYNLTAKIPEHKDLCFLLSLKEYPSLYERLMNGRCHNPKYNKWFKSLQDGMSDAEHNKFLVETFLQTRPLGYSDPVRSDNVSTIMPVIDFLNHNWDGASFSVSNGIRVGDLTVAAHQPFEDSTECFAFYGVLDACDALFRYNFVDAQAPVVRSIECELDLPDGRKIKVANKGQELKRRLPLPEALQDMAYYVPEMTFVKEDGKDEAEQDLELSFLLIPGHDTQAPKALSRILSYAVTHMYQNFGKKVEVKLEDWAREAEDKVLEANEAHYKDVLKHAGALVGERGASPGLERIMTLCDVQLGHMDHYRNHVRKKKKAA